MFESRLRNAGDIPPPDDRRIHPETLAKGTVGCVVKVVKIVQLWRDLVERMAFRLADPSLDHCLGRQIVRHFLHLATGWPGGNVILASRAPLGGVNFGGC
jgi:hypothetical protein